MITHSPDLELDIFLAKSTLVFKKWSFLMSLIIYCGFTAMDLFRFPPEIFMTTIPVRFLFVIIPLTIAVFVHWTKPILRTRDYLGLNLTVYLNAGVVHIFVFALVRANIDTQYSELGFVLLILFGCLMAALPLVPTAIVSTLLLIIMFLVNSQGNGIALEVGFQVAVYASVIVMCLIINASLKRLLTDNYNVIQQFYGDSITDGLTGLKNNRYFVKQTLLLIQQAKTANKEVSLVIIDIDNFKDINDKYGHAYGDDCLSNLGIILGSVCNRKYDFPCRLAGDEFTIVMYDATQEDIKKVCQDILTDIQLHDVEVSIGTATTLITDDMPAIAIKDILFEQADRALYRAKDNGRNMFFSAADLVT
ncbi:GGDEF domain-containing protein [Glaciecola sp. 33A]|uniref:GGDEF domain-containing protein n=1 Tax=Glaciecola sp. 33A TaxID=2057807 RepID=UPI0012FEEE17|nr:GGDEF domain-containing protein [Glaciecola sp. 33A]